MGIFSSQEDGGVVSITNRWNWLAQEGSNGKRDKKVDWLRRRERVVEAMELSWAAYERYAWGKLHPVM